MSKNDEKIYYGQNVEELAINDDCKIMRLRDESGDGLMTMYFVLPGIYLMYNDFHLSQCVSSFKTHTDLLCIDHCREGRIEHDMGNGKYCYLHSGDLRIDRRIRHTGQSIFPLKHYHGITIAFEIEIAKREIEKCLSGFSVDIYELQRKYCSHDTSYIIPGEKEIEHIFSELYNVPLKIKKDYYKVKILELLLYLDALELPEQPDERPYFYKSQIEKIKAIQNLLTSNLTQSYTIEELSEYFDIATTPLKECFKNIYGDPIYTYMKKYRMNIAASLLKTRKDLKIIEIAGMVGYMSHSKFSAAFKQEMGKTPLEYRKSIV